MRRKTHRLDKSIASLLTNSFTIEFTVHTDYTRCIILFALIAECIIFNFLSVLLETPLAPRLLHDGQLKWTVKCVSRMPFNVLR